MDAGRRAHRAISNWRPEERLEMVGIIREYSARYPVLIVFIAALALIAAVACGSDEPAAPLATVAPTSAPDPTPTPEPIVQIVADPIVPAVQPEPGSRESMVFAAFEGQTSAINHHGSK